MRGLPVAQLKNNLTAIVAAAQAKRARVLIVGNRMPPNYGAKYADAFAAAFGELGQALKVPVIPFMLEPIAATRDSFQADNLHPNAAAQPAILDHVWRGLKPLVTR